MTEAAYQSLVPGSQVVVNYDRKFIVLIWPRGTVITVARRGVWGWLFYTNVDTVEICLGADEVCSLDQWSKMVLTS